MTPTNVHDIYSVGFNSQCSVITNDTLLYTDISTFLPVDLSILGRVVQSPIKLTHG